MNYEQLVSIVQANIGALIFAVLGSWLLTALTVKEHLDRDPKDKMSNRRYFIYLCGWLFGYPIMGLIVTSAYLATKNEFGAWLALQIGLTSPAIVSGLAKSGANSLAKKGVEIDPGQ